MEVLDKKIKKHTWSYRFPAGIQSDWMADQQDTLIEVEVCVPVAAPDPCTCVNELRKGIWHLLE